MKITLYFLLLLGLLVPRFIQAAEEDNDAEVTIEEENTEETTIEETTTEEAPKEIVLEDKELWQKMDLDKDGKLTADEFEKFSRSSEAPQFLQNFNELKAIRKLAKKHGIEVEKAKGLIDIGMRAAYRKNLLEQQQIAQIQAQRRREAIARKNRQYRLAQQQLQQQQQQQQQNYWSNLGQQYYRSLQRRGGRTEL